VLRRVAERARQPGATQLGGRPPSTPGVRWRERVG
jgi:hypothetical protein